VTQTATSPRRKPLLDETSFQQLLSAAYVLQEHNDRLREKEAHADFAKNLSTIVETQKLIQTLQLDLEAAAKLVAERAQRITNASGAAVGILEKGSLFYRAGSGSAAVDEGARVTPDSCLSSDCLSTASAVNYADTASSSQAHTELFRERGVKAFIAVPVYHAGQLAGVLELRFDRIHAFGETQLRTAELLAGLLSEAMVTAARLKWKNALASERQSMLEALERIKPQLEQLGTEASVEDSGVESPSAHTQPAAASRVEPVVTREADNCPACGEGFFDEAESFCGTCGTPRPRPQPSGEDVGGKNVQAQDVHNEDVQSRDVQSKDAQSKEEAPWITPYSADQRSNGSAHPVTPEEDVGARAGAFPASLQELIELSAIQQDSAVRSEKRPEAEENRSREPQPWPTQEHLVPVFPEPYPAPQARSNFITTPTAGSVTMSAPSLPPGRVASAVETAREAIAIREPEALHAVPVDPAASTQTIQPYPWSSARKAQDWLETMRGPRTEWLAHQWQVRRANIYVGMAVLILIVVISGWGIRPAITTLAGNASPAANAQHQPPEANLTLFEKLLVDLGLAEAPPAPAYMGNPDVQVWVDVHTALYHCPGTALYGKTPDGRMSTQRDAQRDQFEPSNRKVCE